MPLRGHFSGLNSKYKKRLISTDYAHRLVMGGVHVAKQATAAACRCLRGLLCDSSDTDDALWMVIILLYQDVLLASASWYAVDITFL